MSKGGKKPKIAEFDGIEIRVLTRNEHCDPHVHAFHEGEGWELKIFFSFVSEAIGPIELEAGKRPKRPVVQNCVDAILDNLDEARKQFWEATESRNLHCCLGNQYVRIDDDGYVVAAAKQSAGAMLVKTARYVASSKALEFTVEGQAKKQSGKCP